MANKRKVVPTVICIGGFCFVGRGATPEEAYKQYRDVHDNLVGNDSWDSPECCLFYDGTPFEVVEEKRLVRQNG